MNNKNELIEAIMSAQAGGCGVKSIRKQKYAPASFYMTRMDNKQIGPVNCCGSQEELDRKYDEAVAFLAGSKPTRLAA